LPQLFQSLLEDKLDLWEGRLQVMHLRLLLYPIHIMVNHLCELILCFPQKPHVAFTRSACEASTGLRLEEIKTLLQIWWNVFDRLHSKTTRQRALKQLTETIYHLINLKLAVSFPHLEQFSCESSRQTDDGQELLDIGIRAPREAILACGQILRVTRGMEVELRQLWWPAAVYRVAVVLWTFGFSKPAEQPQSWNRDNNSQAANDFAIDACLPGHPVWQPFLKYNRGLPCITADDGTLYPIDQPSNVLNVCVSLLKEHTAISHLAEFYCNKLESLSQA
jgi:hypothetical protein